MHFERRKIVSCFSQFTPFPKCNLVAPNQHRHGYSKMENNMQSPVAMSGTVPEQLGCAGRDTTPNRGPVPIQSKYVKLNRILSSFSKERFSQNLYVLLWIQKDQTITQVFTQLLGWNREAPYAGGKPLKSKKIQQVLLMPSRYI